jgi:hypothetical protein
MLSEDRLSLDDEEVAVALFDNVEAAAPEAVVADVSGRVPSTSFAVAGSKQPTCTPDVTFIGIAKHCVFWAAQDSSLNDLLAASHRASRPLIHAT